MARYKEYGYDIQNGKAIIPEWETEIKDKYYIIKTIDMSNKKFMLKCIMALMLCLIGLVSCGDKIPTNEILYTTIDNSVLPIEDFFRFGEGRIVSNSYDPDKNVCILKLDKDVTEIGGEAFEGCESLTSITIPELVKEIGEGAFFCCSNLTSITIPESVTEIGEGAFSGCSSLTSISIPESVKKIGGYAFLGCSSLTGISIPPSVTEIGEWAFDDCSSLTSITIPPSVGGIGRSTFSGCSSLTRIIVSKDNKVYDSRENCNAIIHTESNTLISGCKNTIIPESVTKIEKQAFLGCSSLTSISIPPSVTNIGVGAFSRCSSLTSITVSKDNKVYDSREDCNAIIHTESNTLIRGCENTIIPPSVMEIGEYAFSDCKNLTSITIPPSVTEIESQAFWGCSSLTEVRIPKGCNVHEYAFSNSPNVKIIHY